MYLQMSEKGGVEVVNLKTRGILHLKLQHLGKSHKTFFLPFAVGGTKERCFGGLWMWKGLTSVLGWNKSQL